jgi:hypothetical protein
MALTDSVIHETDTERWLLGEKITGTTVVRTRRSPLAAEHLLDPQLVLLETESGVVVEVEVGRSGPRSTAEEKPCRSRSTRTCSARSRCPTFPGWGDLGYEHLELSPWDEFMPSFLHRVPAAPPSPGSSRGSTGS